MLEEIGDLIKQEHPFLEIDKDGRVKCILNGHIMPSNRLAVESFIKGAKYKRLKERYEVQSSFKKYEPFIIQSKNRPEKLYCALTCMLIGKTLSSLKSHMKGKRFLAAKEKFENDDHDLMEEPEFESESESEADQERLEEDIMDSVQDLDLTLESNSLDEADLRNDETQNGAEEAVPGPVRPQKTRKKKSKSRTEGEPLQPKKQAPNISIDLGNKGDSKGLKNATGNEIPAHQNSAKKRKQQSNSLASKQQSTKTQLQSSARQKRSRADASQPKKQKQNLG